MKVYCSFLHFGNRQLQTTRTTTTERSLVHSQKYPRNTLHNPHQQCALNSALSSISLASSNSALPNSITIIIQW